MSDSAVVQAKQQASNNQADWDRYVDARIELYLSRHADGASNDLPDALHEALGQVLAEERRQWRRERELIQSETEREPSLSTATGGRHAHWHWGWRTHHI